MINFAEARTIEPVFDFCEEAHAYTLKGLLLGAEPGDFKVDVKAGELLIQGVAAVTWSDGQSLDYRRERPIDARFVLPEDADVGRCQVVFDSGVLMITVPKQEKLCTPLAHG